MASCRTPHVSFTPPESHIGLDSLADSSPPGQAKGFGQCKDRVMSGASTIKPWTSSKNPAENRLVHWCYRMSQDVTKSTSSLHGKQPGLMWTAVAVHFAAPSGQPRHCCQLVSFSTVTPACGQVRQAVSIVSMAASWPGPARFTNVKPGSQVLQPAPSSVTRPPKTGSQSILSR